MEYNEVISAGRQLFARINTVTSDNGGKEKLDAGEIAKAKELGFSMFNLTEGMTEADFILEYTNPDLHTSKEQEEQFAQQERNIHVKYINLKYGVNLEPQEGESIEQFEARAKDESLNREIDKIVDKYGFGLNENPVNERHAEKMEESWKEYEVQSGIPDPVKQQREPTEETDSPATEYKNEKARLAKENSNEKARLMKEYNEEKARLQKEYNEDKARQKKEFEDAKADNSKNKK